MRSAGARPCGAEMGAGAEALGHDGGELTDAHICSQVHSSSILCERIRVQRNFVGLVTVQKALKERVKKPVMTNCHVLLTRLG